MWALWLCLPVLGVLPASLGQSVPPAITAISPNVGPIASVEFNISGTGLDAPMCKFLFHTSATVPPEPTTYARWPACNIIAATPTMVTCKVYFLEPDVTYYPWVACGSAVSPPPSPGVSYTGGLPRVISVNGTTSGTLTIPSNTTVTLAITAVNVNQNGRCAPLFANYDWGSPSNGFPVVFCRSVSFVPPDTFLCAVTTGAFRRESGFYTDGFLNPDWYFSYFPWVHCLDDPFMRSASAKMTISPSGSVARDTSSNQGCTPIEGFTIHPDGDNSQSGVDFMALTNVTAQEAAAACLGTCNCRSFLTSTRFGQRGWALVKNTDNITSSRRGACFYARDSQCVAPPKVDDPPLNATEVASLTNPPAVLGMFHPNSMSTVPYRSLVTVSLGITNFRPECLVKFGPSSWPLMSTSFSNDDNAMVSCNDPGRDTLWGEGTECTLDTSLFKPYVSYFPWVVCPGGVVSDTNTRLSIRATGYMNNTALACDGDPLTLSCNSEDKIISGITSVFYGRWDTTTCYGGSAEGCAGAAADHTILRRRLENRCIGKKFCSLQMMGWGLVGPCVGTPKALNVTFTCKKWNHPRTCARPTSSDWCSHKGATVFNGECDGDGASDWACKDDAGHRAVLASSKGCVEPSFWGEPAAITECPAFFDPVDAPSVSAMSPREGLPHGIPISLYGSGFDATCKIILSTSQNAAPTPSTPGNCLQQPGASFGAITCLPVEGALSMGALYYPWVYCNATGMSAPPAVFYIAKGPMVTALMIFANINGPTYGDTPVSFQVANFVPGCSVYFGLLDNESAVIPCTNPVVDAVNTLTCTLDASKLVPYYGYFPGIVCPGGLESALPDPSYLNSMWSTIPYIRAAGHRMNPAIACRNDLINLDCSREGKRITRIASVAYGRWDTNTCYGGPAYCAGGNVSRLERYLTDTCVGQPSCSVSWPEPEIPWGDPCYGLHMALRVGFECGGAGAAPSVSVFPALRSEVQTGTVVTVRSGAAFSAGCTVTVGGHDCVSAAVYEGGRALRCLAPSLLPELQTLAVNVTCADITATHELAGPSTTSAPMLTSAWPASGPDLLAAAAAAVAADMPLTINLTGANFGSPGDCYITVGGVPCDNMRALSATAASCTISNVTSGSAGGRSPLVALMESASPTPLPTSGSAIPMQLTCGSVATATIHLPPGSSGGCRPGQVVLLDGSCAPCPAGSYSTDGRSCSPCAAGTYANIPGSQYCGPCGPGWFSDPAAAICSPCPSGTASNEWSVSRCAPCSPGTFAPYGSQGRSKCQSCAPGTFSTAQASSCSACPAGTYSSSNKSSMCLPCRAGTTSPPGSSSCSPCPAGSSSVPGSPSCSPCAPGTASGAAGASVCSTCPAGTYAPGPSASSCTPCGPGTFSPPGATTCSPCQAGSASNKAGADACAPCPVGQVSVQGATACSPCPAGSTSYGGSPTCVTCPAGSYSLAGSIKGCVPCPAGDFSTTPGEASCQACPAGTASGATGRSSADACTTCPPGTFAPPGSKSCKPCGLGAFSNTSGATACTPCAPGYSTDGSRNATACTICPPGTIANQPGSRACTPCPAGYRSNPSGAGALTCAACPAGTTSTPGSATCSAIA